MTPSCDHSKACVEEALMFYKEVMSCGSIDCSDAMNGNGKSMSCKFLHEYLSSSKCLITACVALTAVSAERASTHEYL